MKRKWLLITGIALVLAIASLCGCTQDISVEKITTQQEGIWVNGEGKISVIPDILNLRLGIEVQQVTVAEAQAEAAAAMNEVVDTLTENGIDEKDIQTQRFSISQVTKWDRDTEEQVVIGYRVTNMVTTKIRDIENAGNIIDSVVVAGGDLIRINSLSFTVDDPSAYHEAVREKALVDAANKAEQLASLAGVRLGKPTYISESSFSPPPVRYFDSYATAAMEAPSTPIIPGEMEITLNVQVVYAISD